MQEIRLDTFRALRDHEHKLSAYCPKCARCSELDLERLVTQIRGAYRIVGKRPRCVVCGASGQWQLRAPALKDAQPGRAYI
jgi:hypothetical protein